MSFPEQVTLKSAIANLKEVVNRLHGADTEPVRLLGQIETSADEIEMKACAPSLATVSDEPVVPIVPQGLNQQLPTQFLA
ncbi:MAG TPA: hypothetical protein V6C76_09515 [Drouetiella sp.]